MLGGVALCLCPAEMQAQLITRKDYDAFYDLRQVPLHAGDFFNYNTGQMFFPYQNEFMPGWRWEIAVYRGTRKPVTAEIVMDGREWRDPEKVDYTYDAQGRIATYSTPVIHCRYEYNGDGTLKNIEKRGYSDYRADAFFGQVLSTYNGKPSKIQNKEASVTYSYDDEGRVSRADFLYTYTKHFRSAIAMSPQVTFDYTYDDHDNVTKIKVYRYLSEEKENNAVLMSYDDKNRLTEAEFVGDKDGTSRITYQYDAGGAVVRTDKYLYFSPGNLEKRSSDKYDIQRDTKGRIVAVERSVMVHHYGGGNDWYGTDDVWRKDTYVTYDYDQYDNWTSIKIYLERSANVPYCTIQRTLDYTAKATADTSTPGNSLAAPSGTPEFAPVDDAILKALAPVDNLINTQQYDEAEKLNKRLIKSDKTGSALTRQATILYNRKQYDQCIEVAKEAIDKLQAGSHDYRYAMTLVKYAAVKPYAEYAKAYNDPGHDAKTLNALARKAIAEVEYIGRKDPHNYALWRSFLADLYQGRINATDDTQYYRKKLETLQSKGTIEE